MILYDTTEQANLRLRHCYVLYKDAVLYVRGAFTAHELGIDERKQPDVWLQLRNAEGRDLSVHIADRELFYWQLRSGFFNHRKMAHKLSRRARRRQQQGTTQENTVLSRYSHTDGIRLEDMVDGYHIDIGQFIYNDGRRDKTELSESYVNGLVLGNYPPLEEALKLINEKDYPSVALSPHCALFKDMHNDIISVFLRDVVAGFYHERLGLSLHSKKAYLYEECQQYFPKITKG